MTRATRAAALAVALAVSTLAAASSVSWTTIRTTLAPGVDATSENPCNRGTATCLDAVVKEMRRRERGLASRCDHNVMFAYVYRVTTEQFRLGWPRDFTSPSYMANLDAVFASSYFEHYDRWKQQDPEVPAAWSIAFDAGRGRLVSGVGDMMLGLNAHISRDLPFVLEQVGLTDTDGASAFNDFDGANNVLVEALGVALTGATKRFDPEVAHIEVPGFAMGDEAFRALISTWRAEAWTRAQQLVDAPTPADRQAIADQIEAVAASRALALEAATAYVPFLSNTSDRDRYCRAHR